jgi:hypothetical protein
MREAAERVGVGSNSERKKGSIKGELENSAGWVGWNAPIRTFG